MNGNFKLKLINKKYKLQLKYNLILEGNKHLNY